MEEQIPEKEARLEKLKAAAANVSTFGEKAKQYTAIDELTPVSYTHLDVYKRQAEIEPACGSPLALLDNCILTPHAGAATREASLKMGLLAAQNVIDVQMCIRDSTVCST